MIVYDSGGETRHSLWAYAYIHAAWMRLVPGLGARNAGKLIDRFRTPQAVLRASRSELEAAVTSRRIARLLHPRAPPSGTAGTEDGSVRKRGRHQFQCERIPSALRIFSASGQMAANLATSAMPSRRKAMDDFNGPIFLFSGGSAISVETRERCSSNSLREPHRSNFPHAFCMHATCSVLLTGGWGLSLRVPKFWRFAPIVNASALQPLTSDCR